MIEVILDKSFVDLYSSIVSKESLIMDRILSNVNNKFIINSKLIKYVDENMPNNSMQKWQDNFQFLSDNNRFISSSNNTLNTRDIFLEDAKESDYAVILSNIDTEEKSIFSPTNTSPNNLLFSSLLQNANINFNSLSFTSDNDIMSFFDKIFYCSKIKQNQRILIISRYNNFDCDLIKKLKLYFAKKAYWTTYKNSDSSNDLRYLQRQLGNQLIVYTGRNADIHERKIIVGSLILTFDDDFNKITKNVDTWSCNCTINKSMSQAIFTKQTKLNRLQNRA